LEIVNSVINKGKLADIPELVINAFNETLCKIKPNKQGNQPFRTNKSDLGDQFSVDASDGE
jgi:hypothetical protein